MTPPFLKSGDSIAIVATARKITLEEIQPSVNLFESWGLNPVIHDDLFDTDHQFAGSDEKRTANLQRLLDDRNIQAVIVARGGYGTVRIIDELNFSNFAKHPKWIIGYSDVTVLHSHIHQHFHTETIHSMMAFNMQEPDAESLESLRKILFGEKIKYYFTSKRLNRKGQCIGNLIGGNLSVIYSLLGSASDIETDGKVLFLEDLDEYLYHIDRMMMNMKRNGKLDKLAGLIVGGMSDMKDNTIPFGNTAEEIIAEHVSEYHYPVCFGFPAGHEKRNLAMRLGANVLLEVEDNDCKLSFE